jgi:hypothetical protein
MSFEDEGNDSLREFSLRPFRLRFNSAAKYSSMERFPRFPLREDSREDPPVAGCADCFHEDLAAASRSFSVCEGVDELPATLSDKKIN